MATQVFIGGLMLGFLLGVLVCYVSFQIVNRRWFRSAKQGEIDRLTEEFQELFRQIDEGKNRDS